MRRFFAVILVCVGIFCLAAEPPVGQSHAQVPMTGAGLGAPGGAAVSPSFDVGARTTPGVYTIPSVLGGLTTGHTPEEIIVTVTNNGCVTGTDTVAATSAHLTFTQRATVAGAGDCGFTSFSAQSSGLLATEVITVTCTPCASVSYQEAFACAFYNMNAGSPFDPNGSLPDATIGSLSFSTTHAHDILFAGFRGGGNITLDTLPAQWSLCSQVDFGGGEYLQVTTTQSGVAPTGGGGTNGAIGDALQGP